jgi:hypothetical protein
MDITNFTDNNAQLKYNSIYDYFFELEDDQFYINELR